eukprot:4824749-Lingulodinium_polyedra.AAC.1
MAATRRCRAKPNHNWTLSSEAISPNRWSKNTSDDRAQRCTPLARHPLALLLEVATAAVPTEQMQRQ